MAALRILITGGAGLIASALRRYLVGHNVTALSKEDLDVTNFDQCYENIVRQAEPPDLVIHAAAYTNVDEAETLCGQRKCEFINGYATENIAICCKYLDIPMVYFSTDAIFSGKINRPYTENDITDPKSIYGASKLAGEKFIQKTLNKFFIIRTTWVYGNYRSNFITQAIETFGYADFPLNFSVIDQVATPTNVIDLAKMVGKLIETKAWGVYNYTNSGAASRREVIEYLGELLPGRPYTISDYNKCKAYRPPYCVFDLTKIESLLGPIPHWKDSLKGFV